MPRSSGASEVAPQIGDVGEFARVAQQPVHERQRLFQREELVVGSRQRVRQGGGQTLTPIQPMPPAPEQRAARVRGKLLLGELDGDSL